MDDAKRQIEQEVERNGGLLFTHPTWVARDFLPPGRRLGLAESEYDAGERGFICERWLASVTEADNAVGPPDEGLSFLRLGGGARVTLREATELLPELILGKQYSRSHKGLGRLVKVYDFADRIPFHMHQEQQHARLVGRNSKDEAYYFLEDVDLGPHPETYFGVHPYIVRERKWDVLLPFLKEWKDNHILKFSRAYLNVAGEGFFLPSGMLHAPGTALTLELQEDSDVGAYLQALNAGKIISKEMLFKDVSPEARERRGERAVLDQVNWKLNGDPYFYENHHLSPIPVPTTGDKSREFWVFYNTKKFSGKKIEIEPGGEYTSSEKGVFNIFVWTGTGQFGAHEIEAGNQEKDELLVVHDRAVSPITVKNSGSTTLKFFKFFGPDINDDVPMLRKYR